jgi:hypothetical protein
VAAPKAREAGWLHAWLARLAHPWLRRVLIAVAVLLVVPTLFGGFSLDDYVILYQMDGPRDGEWAGSAPWDLFQWMRPAHNHRLIDGNGMPWWTYENAKLAFLRPVSSWTHFIDDEMFGKLAVWCHFHSLLWFALLIALAMKAYDELIENRWVVGVASAMFALDSAHGSAVGWISNRNAAIVAVFGLAALLCHHRRRRGAGLLTAITGWICFALCLLSGESAVGVFGYVAAYALTYERKPLSNRLGSILPHVLIAGVWAVTRSKLGYGSYGLGAYVDPIHEPLEFLRVLPERFAILLSSQLSRVGADLYDLLPARFRPIQLAWGAAMCIVFVWFALPALRRERTLRFWTVGSLLSVVPLTATVPNDRLLTLVGLGLMPTIAFAVHDALQAVPELAKAHGAAKLRVLCASAFLFVHLVVDPLLLPLTAMTPSLVGRWAASADQALPATPDLRDKTLIVAAAPDSVLLSYLPVMRSLENRPRPDKLYWLAATPSAASFERRAPNVLRVSSPTGLFDQRSEARSPGIKLRKGERVQLSHMTVEVLELTPDGRPTVCDFVFSEPLESSRFVWRVWDSGQVRDFKLPAVGETVQITTG